VTNVVLYLSATEPRANDDLARRRTTFSPVRVRVPPNGNRVSWRGNRVVPSDSIMRQPLTSRRVSGPCIFSRKTSKKDGAGATVSTARISMAVRSEHIVFKSCDIAWRDSTGLCFRWKGIFSLIIQSIFARTERKTLNAKIAAVDVHVPQLRRA